MELVLGQGKNASWWIEEHPLTFTWDLWYACNYRCSYCWWEMDQLWDVLAKQHKVLPPEQWVAVWDRIHSLYGTARLEVLGGEPLLYPRVGELLEGLSRRHFVQVTTNLSPSPEKLSRILDRVSPDRVHFNLSFHPQFTTLDIFLQKALLLKGAGFEPAVLCVTWPPFLSELASYRKQFRDRGIPFTLMIFQGRWEGKTYPEDFTVEESSLIQSLMSAPSQELKEAEVRYRLERQETLGKLCHSGRVYANVKGNGDVFRCGQDAFGRHPIGSIFDPAFRLFDIPKPCPYERCSCLEFKYLDEIFEHVSSIR